MHKNDFKIYNGGVIILQSHVCEFAGQRCDMKIKLNHFIAIGYLVLCCEMIQLFTIVQTYMKIPMNELLHLHKVQLSPSNFPALLFSCKFGLPSAH